MCLYRVAAAQNVLLCNLLFPPEEYVGHTPYWWVPIAAATGFPLPLVLPLILPFTAQGLSAWVYHNLFAVEGHFNSTSVDICL